MDRAAKNYLGAGLAALGLFIAVGFGWTYYNNVSSLRAAVLEKEETLAERQNILANIAKLKEEYKSRAAEVKKISEFIPAKKSLAEMVSGLNEIATTSGNLITDISAGKVENNDNPYSTLSINISSSGTYYTLRQLLANIEKNIRMMDVSVLEIGSSQGGASNNLNAKLIVNTYYLK